MTDSQIRDLEDQLSEALATIDAIRNGEVDAVVVGGPEGQRVFTLDNVDRPYRVIIEQMQEGAVTLGSDGLILYCNRRFAELVELQPQQLIGTMIGTLIADTGLLLAALERGGTVETELMAPRRRVPINLSIVQLAGEADASLRCAVVTDLTQVKARQAEALAARDRLATEIVERRAAEDGLEFALGAADMGSFDIDLATHATRRSERHDMIFGYPDGIADWTLECKLARIVDEEREAVAAQFARAEITGVLETENRIRRADGEIRWVHMKGRTVKSGGKAVRIAGVITDITERRAFDEQVRQIQKMDAVGQLTGGIAHDFNNLLTIIVGNMDMAGRALDNADTARAQRAVGNALKGAERAAVLTQRLLAFSRRTPLEPRTVDVSRLVTGMADLLGRSLGETIQLETVNGAGLWRVEADPNQLENALLNLAVNARDAMPGGGKLTIETQNTRIDEDYSATHAEVSPGQYVSIAVSDTGSGMPPEVIARAFDPFFTTKEVGKGTGLGLSQVYGYVKQTGGHVQIYSEPGQGTTIRIYLPRTASEDVAAPETRRADAERGEATETILVVEDDDEVRTYTVESLRELGYRVLEAHDGPSALSLLDRQEHPISLLFTDVVMPGVSGRELQEAALLRQSQLKVLFTTGYARSAIVHGGRLDAGVELLPKPFTYAELAAKIRNVLDKGNRKRVLVVDGDASARAAAVAVAAELGLSCDVASTVREGLSRLRAAGGDYDATLLDIRLLARRIEDLIEEFRTFRRDLPIVVAAPDDVAGLEARFRDDPCVTILAAPFTSTDLHAALSYLKLNCLAIDTRKD
ncbi:ATP-binding protein [Glacieibacterium sp.]|uniref:ATP-binding protein n=1 Tax=Glacieibacterium sp. TaxID=2860237 RepID=UPI003B00BF76